MKGPSPSKQWNREVALAAVAVAISVLLVTAAGALVRGSGSGSLASDSLTVSGHVTVLVDGKVTYSGDTVMLLDYNYVICKVFNDSTACASAGSNYAGFAGGCRTYTGDLLAGTFTSTTNFYSKTSCSQLGIALSTDTATPVSTNPACASIISTNGLSPVKATTTFTLNTNSITLTASWTATGTQAGIDKVCLFPYDDRSGAVVQPSNTNALAIDLFTAQSLSNGQAFSVQWQFSF